MKKVKNVNIIGKGKRENSMWDELIENFDLSIDGKYKIEEDIELLEKFKNNEIQRDKLERDIRCGGWKIGDIYKCLELDNAIANILSDYKRVLKENEELRAKWDKDTHILQNELDLTNADKINNYIPVQKVKNKIELLEEKAKYEQNAQVLVQLYKQIKVLKELLKESEENK